MEELTHYFAGKALHEKKKAESQHNAAEQAQREAELRRRLDG